MNKSNDMIRDRFFEWFDSLPGFSERNKNAYQEVLGCSEPESVIVLLEAAFTQGYLTSLEQTRVMVSISNEEKEALSGWTDLEEWK